jgi:hypothetical protein
MFTKTSIALAVIVALASSAVAAPKHPANDGLKVTHPSATPDGNRNGWFMEW